MGEHRSKMDIDIENYDYEAARVAIRAYLYELEIWPARPGEENLRFTPEEYREPDPDHPYLHLLILPEWPNPELRAARIEAEHWLTALDRLESAVRDRARQRVLAAGGAEGVEGGPRVREDAVRGPVREDNGVGRVRGRARLQPQVESTPPRQPQQPQQLGQWRALNGLPNLALADGGGQPSPAGLGPDHDSHRFPIQPAPFFPSPPFLPFSPSPVPEPQPRPQTRVELPPPIFSTTPIVPSPPFVPLLPPTPQRPQGPPRRQPRRELDPRPRPRPRASAPTAEDLSSDEDSTGDIPNIMPTTTRKRKSPNSGANAQSPVSKRRRSSSNIDPSPISTAKRTRTTPSAGTRRSNRVPDPFDEDIDELFGEGGGDTKPETNKEDDSAANVIDLAEDDRVAEAQQPAASPKDDQRVRLAAFQCAICMDNVTNLTVTHCGHLFCSECLHSAMHVEATRHKCPICRQKIDMKDRAAYNTKTKGFWPLELKFMTATKKGKQPSK